MNWVSRGNDCSSVRTGSSNRMKLSNVSTDTIQVRSMKMTSNISALTMVWAVLMRMQPVWYQLMTKTIMDDSITQSSRTLSCQPLIWQLENTLWTEIEAYTLWGGQSSTQQLKPIWHVCSTVKSTISVRSMVWSTIWGRGLISPLVRLLSSWIRMFPSTRLIDMRLQSL